MRLDLALPRYGDVDLATLGLAHLFMLPAVERGAWLQHHGIGPALVEIALPQSLDGDLLQRPKAVGIAEIAILAEQVGDYGPRIVGEFELRVPRWDRLPAEQPLFQVQAGGC